GSAREGAAPSSRTRANSQAWPRQRIPFDMRASPYAITTVCRHRTHGANQGAPVRSRGMGENDRSPAALHDMPFLDESSHLACSGHHAWTRAAIRRIEADFNRSADTHLIPLALPGFPGIDVYFKDESSHPTGSLKHRLARSLFLYALANGWLRAGSTVVEASSGSTAVSEA